MYRIDFVLRSATDASERSRFLTEIAALDVHLERAQIGEDGSGAVVYFDPPITVDERAVLVRWLAEHPRVQSHVETVGPLADLEYEFTCSAAPVQAGGRLAGHPFYERGIEFLAEPHTFTTADGSPSAVGVSFAYFTDPDGIHLELNQPAAGFAR